MRISKPRYKGPVGRERIWPEKGVDFEKIFSLVVKMSFIQVVFGITAILDLDIDLHLAYSRNWTMQRF